jgi:hypothetical protein
MGNTKKKKVKFGGEGEYQIKKYKKNLGDA